MHVQIIMCANNYVFGILNASDWRQLVFMAGTTSAVHDWNALRKPSYSPQLQVEANA